MDTEVNWKLPVSFLATEDMTMTDEAAIFLLNVKDSSQMVADMVYVARSGIEEVPGLFLSGRQKGGVNMLILMTQREFILPGDIPYPKKICVLIAFQHNGERNLDGAQLIHYFTTICTFEEYNRTVAPHIASNIGL